MTVQSLTSEVFPTTQISVSLFATTIRNIFCKSRICTNPSPSYLPPLPQHSLQMSHHFLFQDEYLLLFMLTYFANKKSYAVAITVLPFPPLLISPYIKHRLPSKYSSYYCLTTTLSKRVDTVVDEVIK